MNDVIADLLDVEWWLRSAIALLIVNLLLLLIYHALAPAVRWMSNVVYLGYVRLSNRLDEEAASLAEYSAMGVVAWLGSLLARAVGSLVMVAVFANAVIPLFAPPSLPRTAWDGLRISVGAVAGMLWLIWTWEFGRRVIVTGKAMRAARASPVRRVAVDKARSAGDVATPVSTLENGGESGKDSVAHAVSAALGAAQARGTWSVQEPASAGTSLTDRNVEDRIAKVVFSLHGIRTQAKWQRAFSDVAQQANWRCKLDRWYFGRFSLMQFFTPWSREAKVKWFKETYADEISEERLDPRHACGHRSSLIVSARISSGPPCSGVTMCASIR
jgi:hypothetical protein